MSTPAQYSVLGPLKSGATTRAFLGCEVVDGTPRPDLPVVIVWLPDDVVSDPKRVARLQRETSFVTQLDHPHIIRVHGLEHFEEGWARVVDFVDGEPLAQVISRAKDAYRPIDPRLAARIIVDVCDAVHYAHEEGQSRFAGRPVVHGGLRPDTLMVTFSGRTKVTGYGASVLAPTQHGTPMLDKFVYFAPEQIIGGKATASPATDIYAIGAALYELLAGKPPFIDAEDPERAVLTGAPPIIDATGLEGRLGNVAATALAKRGSDRFDSVELMRDAIIAALEGEGQTLPEHAELAELVNALIPESGPERTSRRELLESAKDPDASTLLSTSGELPEGVDRKLFERARPVSSVQRPPRKREEVTVVDGKPPAAPVAPIRAPLARDPDTVIEAPVAKSEAPAPAPDPGPPVSGEAAEPTEDVPRVRANRALTAAEASTDAEAAQSPVAQTPTVDPALEATTPMPDEAPVPSAPSPSSLEVEPAPAAPAPVAPAPAPVAPAPAPAVAPATASMPPPAPPATGPVPVGAHVPQPGQPATGPVPVGAHVPQPGVPGQPGYPGYPQGAPPQPGYPAQASAYPGQVPPGAYPPGQPGYPPPGAPPGWGTQPPPATPMSGIPASNTGGRPTPRGFKPPAARKSEPQNYLPSSTPSAAAGQADLLSNQPVTGLPPAPPKKSSAIRENSQITQFNKGAGDSSRYLMFLVLAALVGLSVFIFISKEPPEGLDAPPERHALPKELVQAALQNADKADEVTDDEDLAPTGETAAVDAGAAPTDLDGGAPAAPEPGRLRLDSDPQVTIFRGGESLGRTPISVTLPPGRHKLRFSDAKTGINVYKTYRIRPGGKHRHKVLFGTSKLVVEAPDGATIFLNARRLGKAPLEPVSIYEGRYLLRVQYDGMSWKETFDAPPGRTIEYKVNLK